MDLNNEGVSVNAAASSPRLEGRATETDNIRPEGIIMASLMSE